MSALQQRQESGALGSKGGSNYRTTSCGQNKQTSSGRKEMEGIFGLRDWDLCGRGRSGHSDGGPYAPDGDSRARTSKPRSRGIKPLESSIKRNDNQISGVLGITHLSVL